MKTLGILLIGIGLILSIMRIIPSEICWIVIFVGIIFILVGFLLKTRAS